MIFAHLDFFISLDKLDFGLPFLRVQFCVSEFIYQKILFDN
jgi:hypothetical protein